MNEFLTSLKADLLSRRMLPLIALLAVGLVAAVAYVVSAGGASKPTTPSSASVAPSTAKGTLPVSVASANPHAAASETPGGSRYQTSGSARNPFTPLPETAAEKATKSAATSAAGSSGSSSNGGSSNGGSTPSAPSSGPGSGGTSTEKTTTTPAPQPPVQPKQYPYAVSVGFGVVPSSGQPPTLKLFKDLEVGQMLPSKQNALLSFERVSTSGSSAVFKLLAPPILSGPARCLPSTSECLDIALAVGKSEKLEYVEEDGQMGTYELKVSSIVKRGQGAAAARVRTVVTGSTAGSATGSGN